jgi:phosphatidylserine/phosphatidylglycerophosphate/cardiolipin synthase-like enzyme
LRSLWFSPYARRGAPIPRQPEHVDVALIDGAQHEIDMAAYVLTDWPVIQALTRAVDRGVKVPIYLDGTQLAEREPAKVFFDLAETPGVEIRIKHESSAPMHLKSYQIDGKLLRTGAANFSASGLKRQDNDLIVIESADARNDTAVDAVWDAEYDVMEAKPATTAGAVALLRFVAELMEVLFLPDDDEHEHYVLAIRNAAGFFEGRASS